MIDYSNHCFETELLNRHLAEIERRVSQRRDRYDCPDCRDTGTIEIDTGRERIAHPCHCQDEDTHA